METTPVERVIHVLLFVTAGLGLGTTAVALLERVTAGGPVVVRARYVAASVAAFVVMLAIERLYHALA